MKLIIETDQTFHRGKVVLDGKDISNVVSAITLKCDVEAIVHAQVMLMPTSVRYEGDVEVLEYLGINGRRLIEDTKE